MTRHASSWWGGWSPLRIGLTLLVVAVSFAATLGVAFGLRLDPNVASLLPHGGAAAALRTYLSAFGGSDLAVVLVRGTDADQVAEASAAVARELEGLPTVEVAADRIAETEGEVDPLLVWRHADARARERLEWALSPAGMRTRLRESATLMVALVGGAATETISRDPLRLVQLAGETQTIGVGVQLTADGAFATEDGLARLVLVRPTGQSLRGADARAFVADAERVLQAQRTAHPTLQIGLTGGHAIAAATEWMLGRDLTRSALLAMTLAALAFVVCFRRIRALVAVLPPLLLGTLWTAGLASLLPGGLSAIAIAFMSVVLGVGVDTGVHVYAALLEARSEGLPPAAAARRARRVTSRPVLVAALVAAVAFASLALSDIAALRQLGILCAGGELLTALAIVVVTPELGAWLERGPAVRWRPLRWTGAVVWLTATRRRALVVAAVTLAPIVAIALGYGPTLAESLVAVRPERLEPNQVQRQVYEAFGGQPGQWVVLVADPDPGRARERADQIAERVASMDDVLSVDALTALAPAQRTQTARLAARDALDLSAKADELERALSDTGFDPTHERMVAVLDSMRHPPHQTVSLGELEGAGAGVLLSRYLAQQDGRQLVALYLHPRDDPAAERRVQEAIRQTDPEAMITGYARLESSLRASLGRDLPRIGLVAALLVSVALAFALRRGRDIALAALVVIAELAAVLVLVRLLNIPLHVYDALVLPVLLGVTVDEGMFLLYRARGVAQTHDEVAQTIHIEGPPVTTTALTSAAGFGALMVCDFDGLRHLGMVGALGSVVGLVVALVMVPAGLRLLRAAPSA